MKTDEIELHIEKHFSKSPVKKKAEPDLEKEAQKLREQREFEMLRAQYGMDDQGNFREQSSSQMQRAVYAGEMSVADYYERQVGLRAAESHGKMDFIVDGPDDLLNFNLFTRHRWWYFVHKISSSASVVTFFICSGSNKINGVFKRRSLRIFVRR